MKINNKKQFAFFLSTALLTLSGCDSMKSNTPVEAPLDSEMRHKKQVGNLLGAEGIMFGGPSKPSSSGATVGINVNAYLWRASLATLNFMPLASADAAGGVLITDWYTSANNTSERIKVNVAILSSELRVSSLKVTVYKQKLQSGQWINQSDDERETASELETIILTKARQLRIAAQ